MIISITHEILYRYELANIHMMSLLALFISLIIFIIIIYLGLSWNMNFVMFYLSNLISGLFSLPFSIYLSSPCIIKDLVIKMELELELIIFYMFFEDY